MEKDIPSRAQHDILHAAILHGGRIPIEWSSDAGDATWRALLHRSWVERWGEPEGGFIGVITSSGTDAHQRGYRIQYQPGEASKAERAILARLDHLGLAVVPADRHAYLYNPDSPGGFLVEERRVRWDQVGRFIWRAWIEVTAVTRNFVYLHRLTERGRAALDRDARPQLTVVPTMERATDA